MRRTTSAARYHGTCVQSLSREVSARTPARATVVRREPNSPPRVAWPSITRYFQIVHSIILINHRVSARGDPRRAAPAFRPFAFTSAAHPPTRVDTQSETQSAPAHVDIRRRTVNLQHSSLSQVSTRSPHPPHPPLAERPCGVVSDTVLVVNGCQRAVATAVGEEHAQQRLRECELLMRRHLRGRP